MQILQLHNHMGGSLDPNSCFLLQRGIKTLPLRVRQQNANALALAQFLQGQPQVMPPCTKASPARAHSTADRPEQH